MNTKPFSLSQATSTDPTRILMRQMMGAVAQYDKSQIVLKLRGARMRKRAKEGRCEGRKPFGYYEGENAALERIRALRAEGLGFGPHCSPAEC